MTVVSAFGTFPVVEFSFREAQIEFGCHDTRRHRDDSVTNQHDDRRNELTRHCHRSDISIPDRRDGHDAPIDRLRDTAESGVPGDHPFHDIHRRPEDHSDGDDEKEEDRDLGETGPERIHDEVCLSDVPRHFQNTENPQQSQDADDEEILGTGQEDSEIRWNDGEDIDDPEKAEKVACFSPHHDHPHDILDRKEDREDPFHDEEKAAVFCLQLRDALEHHDADTDSNEPEQNNVKGPARLCIGKKNDAIEPVPQAAALVLGGMAALIFKHDSVKHAGALRCQAGKASIRRFDESGTGKFHLSSGVPRPYRLPL